MATMKKTTKTTAKPKLKKAQAGGYNDTSGKKKLGPALGIGIPVTGMVAAGANMIKNAVKRKKEKKASEERKLKLQSTIKAAREKATNVPKSVKKKGGVAKYRTGGIKKYQPGGGTGTPFQNYLKNTPGAVPSDTVMQTVWPGEKWDYPKKPVAKNPNNQNLLEKVYEQTYGQGWRSEDRKADDETFEQYKRRMGPLKQKGGAAKATYKTGGMVNPNAKVSKQTKPGSKGVKPNVNPKAAAAKRATGRVGGTSKAPRTAKPKNK
jgi:hypothetical protein